MSDHHWYEFDKSVMKLYSLVLKTLTVFFVVVNIFYFLSLQLKCPVFCLCVCTNSVAQQAQNLLCVTVTDV